MKNIILIFVSLVGTFQNQSFLPRYLQTTCNDINNFIYQGQCISKSCLWNQMTRISMTPSDDLIKNPGIKYTVDIINSGQQGMIYLFKVQYNDEDGNEIVSDPLNCIDWTIYQTKNDYDIDSTRIHIIGGDETKPNWPLPVYAFNGTIASLSFFITQGDLDTRQCLKFVTKDTVYWECYFELAFQIQQITQISYYMNFQITLNDAVQSSIPSVNFANIIQVDKCQSDENCLKTINVQSSLLFCQDKICSVTGTSPFYQLYINRVFNMKFLINDRNFNNYYINNMTITYQTQQFKLTLKEKEYIIINHVPGYISFQLIVPIVADQVIITAGGYINDKKNRILQNNSSLLDSTPISHASQTFGPILDTPLENITNTTNTINQTQNKISNGDRLLVRIINILLIIIIILLMGK